MSTPSQKILRLRLLIACRGVQETMAPAYDFDTHDCIRPVDLRIMISTAGSGLGSNVEIVTGLRPIPAIGLIGKS